MNNKYRILLYSLSLLPCLICADVVRFINGDQIQGSILEWEKDKVEIATEAMETVKISSTAISSLSTDSSLSIKLKNGSPLKGKLTFGKREREVHIIPNDDNLPFITHLDNIVSLYKEETFSSKTSSIWKGNIDLGFAISSGNTNSSSLDTEFEITKTFSKQENIRDSIHFNGKYQYSEKDRVTDKRKGGLESYYKGRLPRRWSWFLSEKFSFNDSQDLSLQVEEAIGFSYSLLERALVQLELTFGVARLDSYYDPGENRHYFTLPLGWEFKWKILPKLIFSNHIEYLPKVSAFDNYFLDIQSKLEVPLSNSTAINLKHERTFSSRPPSGKNKIDQSTSLRLNYKF